mmetsp:Transcript_33642/g.106967  ORF Transcript_33642/g.106967 Transcript_33642/m.106967 type:complete len:263 (+) Transcript_33642:524-1312(+)
MVPARLDAEDFCMVRDIVGVEICCAFSPAATWLRRAEERRPTVPTAPRCTASPGPPEGSATESSALMTEPAAVLDTCTPAPEDALIIPDTLATAAVRALSSSSDDAPTTEATTSALRSRPRVDGAVRSMALAAVVTRRPRCSARLAPDSPAAESSKPASPDTKFRAPPTSPAARVSSAAPAFSSANASRAEESSKTGHLDTTWVDLGALSAPNESTARTRISIWWPAASSPAGRSTSTEGEGCASVRSFSARGGAPSGAARR